MSAFADVAIDATNFPDANFRQYVSDNFDEDGDGALSDEEISELDYIGLEDSEITSLKGIEFFTALEELECSSNRIISLDVSKNTALTHLSCYDNLLTELDLSKNVALESLSCEGNQLMSLDVSGCTALIELYCDSNKLTNLDVNNCTKLEYLYCKNNQLTNLDLSKNTGIKQWGFSVEGQESETLVYTQQNDGTYQVNLIDYVPDLSRVSDIYSDALMSSNDKGVLTFKRKPLVISYTYDTKLPQGIKMDVVLIKSQENAPLINVNEENFPDENFRSFIAQFDMNKDSRLNDLEVADITEIEIDFDEVSSLKGIEFFVALKKLICGDNQLKELDLSNNIDLMLLYCSNNQLTKLDLSHNTALTELYCSGNKLTELDLSHNTALTELDCSGNQLTELDLSNNTALEASDYDQSFNLLSSLRQANGTYKVDLKKYVSDLSRVSNVSCEDYDIKTGIAIFSEKPSELIYAYNTKAPFDEDCYMLVKLYQTKKPVITTESLPKAEQSKEYSCTLDVDGESDITWTLENDSLPSGLSLSKSGTISGIPTEGGSFDVIVIASNEYGTDVKELTLIVNTVINITPESLVDSGAGAKYNATLQATGGTSPYTWVINSGSLPTGLTLDESKGTISGTPSQKGTYEFEVKVSDKNGITATKAYTITITGPEISGTLNDGVLKAAYSGTLTATGGTSPYTWTMSGSAPKGLKLNKKTGVISGKPTKAGTFTFEVKVTDKNKATATQEYTITISEPQISGWLNYDGKVKAPYSGEFTATGGTAPYTWTKSGSLPKGVTLDKKTGVISGTPTKAGTYKFKIKVTDKNKATATTLTFTITITAPAITGTLNNSTTLEAPYEGQLTASGGTEPYIWSISSGKFPPGLTLDTSTGRFSGNSTKAGKYSFKVRVTDANGAVFTTKSIKITVTAPKISGTLKGGTTGVQYSSTLKVSGGVTPFTWTVSSGTLPGGLEIDENTGTISGVPEEAGTYKFTVRAEDVNGGAAEKSYKLKIKKGKNLSVKSSNEVYDESVYVDDEAVEGIEIEDGRFTLPAEFVHDGFRIKVKARADDSEPKTEELYISAE